VPGFAWPPCGVRGRGPDKIKHLDRRDVDTLEPGLASLVSEGLAAGRLSFVVGVAAAVADAEVVYLCVPTPICPRVAELTAPVVIDTRNILDPDTLRRTGFTWTCLGPQRTIKQ
jgi:UDP-glucose/GDP-mannose dehydrogenase family protein